MQLSFTKSGERYSKKKKKSWDEVARDGVVGIFMVSTVMSSCSTLSTNSRWSELRSAVATSLMSSLEHIQAAGDVSSGHGEPDVESLLSDQTASSKSCFAASWNFFFGVHLKEHFHADLIFLQILLSCLPADFLSVLSESQDVCVLTVVGI